MDDPILGKALAGTQLATIPPNASSQHQITVINDIISILNNTSRDVVQTDTVQFNYTDAPYTLLAVPHNLGYKPRAFAYLNNTTLTMKELGSPGGSQTIGGVDIPLPTYLNAPDFTIGRGGSDPIPPPFYDWLNYFVDKTNIYFVFSQSLGNVGSLSITYSLTRLPSQASG